MTREQEIKILTADKCTEKEMILADELREMIALGWTDEEAHADTAAFFERIGDAAEGLAEETIWSVWKNVLEIVQEEQNENQKNL